MASVGLEIRTTQEIEIERERGRGRGREWEWREGEDGSAEDRPTSSRTASGLKYAHPGAPPPAGDTMAISGQ